MGRTRLATVVTVLTITALPACGDAEVPMGIATPCEASFSVLAAAHAGTEDVDVPAAEHETLRECDSSDDWLAAAADHRDLFDEGDLHDALAELCARDDDSAALPACGRAAE